MSDESIDNQPKKVFIKTFGCQMNEYDSGKIRALLGRDGYVTTDKAEGADLVLVNTCSVREKPENKLHSFIGGVKKYKKDGTKIAIAGCMAQHDGARLFDKYKKEVDLVFGPDQLPQIQELVKKTENGRVLANDFMDLDNYAFVRDLDPAAETATGAFVTIQKGCDNKCTFCIVPATRGIEVSRPSGEIVEEVRACVSRGVKEITLIGQNVNSYGLKVPGEKSFSQLLYAVADVAGVERIRYTTSHPRDMGADVMQAYSDLPQLTSHLHLPVQSGSSRVLRRMKRFYTREQFLRVVDGLHAARPDISFSTDIIVGFPGETDEDFEETMSLLEEVRFDSSFSFKYSERPGTSALRLLDDSVAPEVATERLMRFQARQRELQIVSNNAMEGKVYDVLVEGRSKWDENVVCGRTGTYKMVNFPGSMDLVGEIVPVNITKGFVNSLRGERI